MNEFSLIENYFKPLAQHFPGSLNLSDDAAIIQPPAGQELVVSTDAISEGVHFLGNEDPALIAKKLLRVNMSDLAAMGATPLAYFLAIMLPNISPSPAGGGLGHVRYSAHQAPPLTSPLQGEGIGTWVKRFAEGLAEDQKQFSIPLAGGDTTSTKGAMSFCVTALGSVPAGRALRRNAATPGESLYVSGTLGDSALGLLSLRGTGSRNDELINRYLVPLPRLALGQKLIGVAHAAIDISDGLVQDLGHICKASGVGAIIHRPALPLSSPAAQLIKSDNSLWDYILGGGDDYELLFTVPVEKEEAVRMLATELALPLTRIGSITKGSEVRVEDESGNPLAVACPGFTHFSD